MACYLLGYGFFAIPGAMFIKRYTYKSGVLLGLGMYAMGTFLFYPAMLASRGSVVFGFSLYLFALVVLFAGLSILETSANSYVCRIGPESTATQRLNFAQSFNPFGAIAGVVLGAAFLTQVQGIVSDQSGSIIYAYWVPAVAFLIIAWYSSLVAKKFEISDTV